MTTLTKRLPNLAASMRLAIEVFDRSGSGLARVDDDTAAIWNNKFSCVAQRIQRGSNAIEVMNRSRGCAARRVDATTEVKPGGLAGQSGDTASAGSHSCMVRRERPLALRTGIATAADPAPVGFSQPRDLAGGHGGLHQQS